MQNQSADVKLCADADLSNSLSQAAGGRSNVTGCTLLGDAVDAGCALFGMDDSRSTVCVSCNRGFELTAAGTCTPLPICNAAGTLNTGLKAGI
mmetsp:Transcript_77264/g.167089  ORF Transcript_77264/g.167089 Transcript_77264/m.167089 type:complete len:93 (+) Transcript_77264:982-1260(+)